MAKSRFLIPILSVLILSSPSVLPARATDATINISCSDGGSFTFNSTSHEVSSAITCKGSASIPEGANVGKAFAGSGVTKIILPDDTVALDAGLFTNTLVTSVDLPPRINQVNREAFNGSIVQSINVPDGVTGLSADSFSMAARLQSIIVDLGNPLYKSKDGVLFDNNFNSLLAYPRAKTDSSYSIPETVTRIATGAFANQNSLVNLYASKSLKQIDSHAFLYAASIKNFSVPTGTSLGLHALSGLGVALKDRSVKCGSGGTFSIKLDVVVGSLKCQGAVTIPNDIRIVSDRAFDGSRITNLIVPTNVEEIGSLAFRGNPLTSISLTAGLTAIGPQAFSGVSALKSISLPPTLITIGRAAFEKTNALKKIVVSEGVTSIGSGAFSGVKSDADIYLPNSVLDITGAFGGTKLRSVRLPDGLKTVGSHAFYGAKVAELTIPDSVETIADSAFTAAEVKSLKLSKHLREIGPAAFSCGKNMQQYVVPASVTRIYQNSFYRGYDCPEYPDLFYMVYFLGDAPEVVKVDRRSDYNYPLVFIGASAKGWDGQKQVDPATTSYLANKRGIFLSSKAHVWGYFDVVDYADPGKFPQPEPDYPQKKKPVIVGEPYLENTISVDVGSYPEGTTFIYDYSGVEKYYDYLDLSTYKWRKAQDHTKSTLFLDSYMFANHYQISVHVTVKVPGYRQFDIDSDKLAPISLGPIPNAPTPTISSSTVVPKSNSVLTALTDNWMTGTTLSYQWFRDDKIIAGSKASTYKVTSKDLGHLISVAVTGVGPTRFIREVFLTNEPEKYLATTKKSAAIQIPVN